MDRLAFSAVHIENRPGHFMATNAPDDRCFSRGAIVLATLNNPREKFWGAVLDVTGAGLSIRGIDLNSFEDFTEMVRSGEPATPGAVFFPMHRIERIELDCRSGNIPSLAERFAGKVNREASIVFNVGPAPIPPGCTLLDAERRFVASTVEAMDYDLDRAAESLGITPTHVRRVLAIDSGSEGDLA